MPHPSTCHWDTISLVKTKGSWLEYASCTLWKVSIVNGFNWYFPVVMPSGELWESWPGVSHQSSMPISPGRTIVTWIFSARPPNHAAAAFCRNTLRQKLSLRVPNWARISSTSNCHQSILAVPANVGMLCAAPFGPNVPTVNRSSLERAACTRSSSCLAV